MKQQQSFFHFQILGYWECHFYSAWIHSDLFNKVIDNFVSDELSFLRIDLSVMLVNPLSEAADGLCSDILENLTVRSWRGMQVNAVSTLITIGDVALDSWKRRSSLRCPLPRIFSTIGEDKISSLKIEST